MIVIMAVVMFMIVVMAMMMLMVVIISGFFLFAVHGHLHVRSRDSAFDGRLRLHLHARQAKGVHLINERLPVAGQFQQRRGQHIPGSAHVAFQI